MGISQLPAATSSSAASAGTQTFTSSGTWTAPAGVTAVTATVVGGGGGGGASGNSTTNSNYNFPGGGGAGGAVTTQTVSVTPGTTYSVVVGSGGSKGTATNTDSAFVTAGAGGYSSFALSYTVQNAITNGAVELGGPGDWLQGEEPNSSVTNPPSYPNGYNGSPVSQPATNTNTTNRTSITNVTGVFTAGQTRWFTNDRGNSGYRDLILWVPVVQNTQYILSAYGGSNSSNMNGRIRIDWYSGFNSGLLGNMQSTTQTLPTTNWVRFSATGTSPSGATWALVRLMSDGTSPIYTGVLLQTGSTQNDYVGPFTSSSNKVVTGLGLISVTAGVVNNGGGGGNGCRTTTVVAGSGFGGGQAVTTGGTFVMGGNGAGAGTPGVFNIVADRNSIPYINTFSNPSNGGGGISSGNAAITLNSTNGGYIIQPNGNTGLNGYGAGGMGARASNVIAGVPGPGVGAPVGAGSAGNSATANTGAGGGGGMYTTSASSGGVNGGDGGSGIVILSW